MTNHGGKLVGCEGKVAFTSFGLANQAAKRNNRGSIKRQAYHCLFCGQYHIENMSGISRGLKQKAKKARDAKRLTSGR